MGDITQLFPVGPPLDERAQIGRRPFIDGLDDRASRGEKLKLFATRRTGKTSVARAVVLRFRAREHPAAIVDLARLQSHEEVAESLIQQLNPATARVRSGRDGASRILGRLASGQTGEEAQLASRLAEALAATPRSPAAVLGKLAERGGEQPAFVVLDEAHRLAGWPEAEQDAIRAFIRDDPRVGMLIASSESSALEQLTADGAPLQYAATRLPLPAIDRGDWTSALNDRFTALSAQIHLDAVELLIELANAHPYCTMLLARESAVVSEFVGQTSAAAVRAGLLIAEQDDAWELRHDQLA